MKKKKEEIKKPGGEEGESISRKDSWTMRRADR